MAKVVKVAKRWCVAHETTGAVLVRKGRKVCFVSRGAAVKDATATRRRVIGK